MDNNNTLKSKVMARVYVEYTKNLLVEHADLFMSGLFVAASFVLVSIHDVLANIPKDNFTGLINFFVVAVKNTSIVIQVLLAGFLVRVLAGGAFKAYKNLDAKYLISQSLRLSSINIHRD